MCDEIVGAEKVVHYRRQFFNVYDDVQNHTGDSQWHCISSGSKAEGLNLPGSDYHQHMHDIGATGYDKTIRRV
jgi:hypothetical protein